MIYSRKGRKGNLSVQVYNQAEVQRSSFNNLEAILPVLKTLLSNLRKNLQWVARNNTKTQVVREINISNLSIVCFTCKASHLTVKLMV